MESITIAFPETIGKSVRDLSVYDDPADGREVLVHFDDGTQLSINIGVKQTVDARYSKGKTLIFQSLLAKTRRIRCYFFVERWTNFVVAKGDLYRLGVVRHRSVTSDVLRQNPPRRLDRACVETGLHAVSAVRA